MNDLVYDIRIPSSVFNKAYIPSLTNTARFENIMGGAGSGKSVFAAQKKVYQHLNDGRRNTLVVRNVGKTNRHSTFPEIIDVINKWKVRDLFTINKTDMTITRKGGGQFMFAGLDDVEKLKSIKFPNGILTDILVEEATECKEDDIVQLNLRMRGQSPFPFQNDIVV